jgi:type II secretory pathway component PulF
MLADYFQRQSNVLIRLRSLMVYPLIVLFAAFLISVLITVMWGCVIAPSFMSVFAGMGIKLPGATLFALEALKHIWIFPVIMGILFFATLGIFFITPLSGRFLWRLPAFKEASVARVAAALNLLLKHGVSLPDAISLVSEVEANVGAVADLRGWQKNISGGVAKFSEVARTARTFPPMFIWVVAGAGEDLAGGFNRAAEIYQSRAIYRTEMAVYSVLPFASMILGAVVLSQAYLVLCMFLPFIAMISNLSGG